MIRHAHKKMKDIIYDGSKDRYENYVMIVRDNDKYILKNSVGNNFIRIITGPVINYGRYLTMYYETTLGISKYAYYDKQRNIYYCYCGTKYRVKTICYDDHIYTWFSIGKCVRRCIDTNCKEINGIDINKDRLTLLVGSLPNYDPSLVKYGTVLYDPNLSETPIQKISMTSIRLSDIIIVCLLNEN